MALQRFRRSRNSSLPAPSNSGGRIQEIEVRGDFGAAEEDLPLRWPIRVGDWRNQRRVTGGNRGQPDTKSASEKSAPLPRSRSSHYPGLPKSSDLSIRRREADSSLAKSAGRASSGSASWPPLFPHLLLELASEQTGSLRRSHSHCGPQFPILPDLSWRAEDVIGVASTTVAQQRNGLFVGQLRRAFVRGLRQSAPAIPAVPTKLVSEESGPLQLPISQKSSKLS